MAKFGAFGSQCLGFRTAAPQALPDDKGPTEVLGGKFMTTAHFSAPGTYTVIAVADDTALTTLHYDHS